MLSKAAIWGQRIGGSTVSNKKPKTPLSSILVALANGESSVPDTQAQRNTPVGGANAFGSNNANAANAAHVANATNTANTANMAYATNATNATNAAYGGRDGFRPSVDHNEPRAPMEVVKFTDNDACAIGSNARGVTAQNVNGKTSKQAPFASPLLSQYPRRQSRDHVTVPILAQNVVFEERPRVIKSLAHLDDPFPTLEQQIAQRRALEEEVKRQKAAEAESEAQKAKENSSAHILGARVINEQPINSATGRSSGQWGRQLQAQAHRSRHGNQEDEELLAALAGSNVDIEQLISPDRIFERTQQYKRDHVYEKAGQKSEQPSTVMRSLEEVQQARAKGQGDNSGPSFLGQSAKALLRAQNNPRAPQDSASDPLGVGAVDPLRALPMFDDGDTVNANKQGRNVPQKERLVSGEAKLLVEYFSPFMQEGDLIVTDVRAQLERVPFIAVRAQPQGNMIVGILCEDSYEELRDNPRLILSYSVKLQRYRQRLAEDMSYYLRIPESQALMLFDAMTGFICLERLDVEQVRRLIQFYSTHRVVKERRRLMRLFTNQDEHTRIMCPVEGMYQLCHNYLQQNFVRQKVPANAQEADDFANSTNSTSGASSANGNARGNSFFSSSLAGKGINLAEAFRDFLQIQEDDGKESQRETLRQLQEYLQEAKVVNPAYDQSEANQGEIWFGKCQDLPPLQARGEASDLFALLPQNYDQNKLLPARLDWERIVSLCQHLNQSYQPLKRAISVYVPKPELLVDPAAVHRALRAAADRPDAMLAVANEVMAQTEGQRRPVQRVSPEVDAKAAALMVPPPMQAPQPHTPIMERLVGNAAPAEQGQTREHAHNRNHHGHHDHRDHRDHREHHVNGAPIDRAAIAAYRARAEGFAAEDAAVPRIGLPNTDAEIAEIEERSERQHAAHIQARQALMQSRAQQRQQQQQQQRRAPQQSQQQLQQQRQQQRQQRPRPQQGYATDPQWAEDESYAAANSAHAPMRSGRNRAPQQQYQPQPQFQAQSQSPQQPQRSRLGQMPPYRQQQSYAPQGQSQQRFARYAQAPQGGYQGYQEQEPPARRPDPRAAGYVPEGTASQGRARGRDNARNMRPMPRQERSFEPQQELRMPEAMGAAPRRAQPMPSRQQKHAYRQPLPQSPIQPQPQSPMEDDGYDAYDEQPMPPRQQGRPYRQSPMQAQAQPQSPMVDDGYDAYDEQPMPPRQAMRPQMPQQMPPQGRQERATVARNASRGAERVTGTGGAAGNYLTQSLAVPADNYAQQRARYQEAAVLGRNVSAPQILDSPYNDYPMDGASGMPANGDDDAYSMDFSLNPLGGRGSNGAPSAFQEQRAGANQGRRGSTLTSVSVADVDFVPVSAAEQDFSNFDNAVDGATEQMQWQGSLSVDFATPSLGGGYNPQNIARNISQAQAQARTQGQTQMPPMQVQPQAQMPPQMMAQQQLQQSQSMPQASQAAGTAPAAASDEDDEINALVQAALAAEKQ